MSHCSYRRPIQEKFVGILKPVHDVSNHFPISEDLFIYFSSISFPDIPLLTRTYFRNPTLVLKQFPQPQMPGLCLIFNPEVQLPSSTQVKGPQFFLSLDANKPLNAIRAACATLELKVAQSSDEVKYCPVSKVDSHSGAESNTMQLQIFDNSYEASI